MPGEHGKKHRKHTPIVSQAQRGLFGAAASGKSTKARGLTRKVAMRHLKEVKGKELPVRRRTLTRK